MDSIVGPRASWPSWTNAHPLGSAVNAIPAGLGGPGAVAAAACAADTTRYDPEPPRPRILYSLRMDCTRLLGRDDGCVSDRGRGRGPGPPLRTRRDRVCTRCPSNFRQDPVVVHPHLPGPISEQRPLEQAIQQRHDSHDDRDPERVPDVCHRGGAIDQPVAPPSDLQPARHSPARVHPDVVPPSHASMWRCTYWGRKADCRA